MVSEENKKFLLNLSRTTLESAFREENPEMSSAPDEITNLGACFVSFYKDGIPMNSAGSLFPFRELFHDVRENTLLAAFKDPNYPIIKKEELNNVKIEISLIKNLKKIKFQSEEELFSQITPNIHGVILNKDKKISTLLPSAWKQLPDKESVLGELCKKIGMDKDSWKLNADIVTYETETFGEN